MKRLNYGKKNPFTNAVRKKINIQFDEQARRNKWLDDGVYRNEEPIDTFGQVQELDFYHD